MKASSLPKRLLSSCRACASFATNSMLQAHDSRPFTTAKIEYFPERNKADEAPDWIREGIAQEA